jgi:5,10-methylenetetrahydrofolate reductase
MQSWEAKVLLGAEQNYASNSFNSELIKRFQQLLANLSIIIGSALVEEKRQLNHSSN